ncbi:hypothetical protein Tco_0472368 [Tanacetum coccineum]
MAEPTIEEYMMKTQEDYGSGIARPKIDENAHFELKGQFLKELCDNTFSGSYNDDVNEHIEKVLEIVDKKDGYCNTGDLPRFICDGNSIRYEDYEWYDTIDDGELKEEALINKWILEESMKVMEESSDDKWDHDSPVDE